jgi:hypothetical protein
VRGDGERRRTMSIYDCKVPGCRKNSISINYVDEHGARMGGDIWVRLCSDHAPEAGFRSMMDRWAKTAAPYFIVDESERLLGAFLDYEVETWLKFRLPDRPVLVGVDVDRRCPTR